jgi:hypothetical protein
MGLYNVSAWGDTRQERFRAATMYHRSEQLLLITGSHMIYMTLLGKAKLVTLNLTTSLK